MKLSPPRLFLAMFLVAAFAPVGSVGAQARGGGAPAAPDFSKVESKAEKIAGNFYTVRSLGPDFYPAPNGRPMATIGVLAGPDGAFMVDASFAPLYDKINAALKTAQPDGRIRFLVNTHVHGDHTGGDESFGKAGVTLLARENLRKRLAVPSRGGAMPNPAALPMLTFDAPLTFRMNGDEVRVIPLERAHTDGDVIVQFVNADVIMTGDIFRFDNAYPNMDLDNGGSLNGMLAALNTIANTAGANTKIIPGHGPVADKAAVLAHRDMIMAVRDKVAALKKEGRTQEQVIAAGVTADYDKQGLSSNAARFVGQLFQEVSR